MLGTLTGRTDVVFGVDRVGPGARGAGRRADDRRVHQHAAGAGAAAARRAARRPARPPAAPSGPACSTTSTSAWPSCSGSSARATCSTRSSWSRTTRSPRTRPRPRPPTAPATDRCRRRPAPTADDLVLVGGTASDATHYPLTLVGRAGRPPRDSRSSTGPTCSPAPRSRRWPAASTGCSPPWSTTPERPVGPARRADRRRAGRAGGRPPRAPRAPSTTPRSRPLFEAQAAATPDAPALAFEDVRRTYGELDGPGQPAGPPPRRRSAPGPRTSSPSCCPARPRRRGPAGRAEGRRRLPAARPRPARRPARRDAGRRPSGGGGDRARPTPTAPRRTGTPAVVVLDDPATAAAVGRPARGAADRRRPAGPR